MFFEDFDFLMNTQMYFDIKLNLQCTIRVILLLTEGGTPLLAMHKYAPICSRLTLTIVNMLPIPELSIEEAETIHKATH